MAWVNFKTLIDEEVALKIDLTASVQRGLSLAVQNHKHRILELGSLWNNLS